MFIRPHTFLISTAFGLLASGTVCAAKEISRETLEQTIQHLRKQNSNLQLSLVEANRAEKESTEQLNQVRERLEALGKNLLDGGDDRLIQAAADLEIATERINRLETAGSKLTSSVQNYLAQAVGTDPQARLMVETSIRELDSVSGLRQKPLPNIRTGSLRKANVVSLDEETGMLVLNLGETQGAKIGMTFRLRRGKQTYGTAILADVRRSVSGAFVENIDLKDYQPRLNDQVVLITQQ